MLNTNPYTYLGNRPLDLSPAATLDRGLVAITFKTLKVGAILHALGGALRGGGMKPSETVDVQTPESTLRGIAELTLEKSVCSKLSSSMPPRR